MRWLKRDARLRQFQLTSDAGGVAPTRIAVTRSSGAASSGAELRRSTIAPGARSKRSRRYAAAALVFALFGLVAGFVVQDRNHVAGRLDTGLADGPAKRVPPAPSVTNDRSTNDRSTNTSSDTRSSELLPADVATVERAAAAELDKSSRAQPSTTPPPRAAPDTTTSAPRPSPAASAPPAATTPRAASTPPAGAADERANARLANGDTIAAVETDAAQVLALARRAAGPDADDRILQGARSMRAVTDVPSARPQSPAVGRRLNSEARAAWERQDIDTALRLQQRAFEASPNDPELVGNLAFFYLKAKPAQPALARRLALHALGARGSAFPAGRAEDWGTLAVASSLLGREADAIDSMYVMLATSNNPERACRAALMAVAQYGRPMQAPANALRSRIRARGGVPAAPSCE